MPEYSVVGWTDVSGNGSLIVPEYWIPRYAKALSTKTCWSPFVTGQIDGAKLLAAGQGDTIHCTFMGNINVPTSDNTFGSWTATGTQSVYQTSLTVAEFSNKIIAEGIELYQIGQGLDSIAMDSVIANSIAAWEYRLGGAALAATYNFDCRAADSLVYSLAAGGTVGTSYLLPFHVRNMVAEFRRNDIPGFREINGAPYDYVLMAPPGMLGAITAQTEFQNIAAVQAPEFYSTGAIGIYQGVLCVEETGAGRRLTRSTSVGTGVFMGPALLGDNTLGKSPDTYAMWGDTRDHPGRVNYIGWRGYYCAGLVPAVGTCVRCATIHAKCE